MQNTSTSCVTLHMAASLDGFIARRDGSVDWMQTHDRSEAGETLEPAAMAEFLRGIDCYVMGSRTYELATDFEARGMGWAYGDTPTFVLAHRALPKVRPSVEFLAGDLADLIKQLRTRFCSIWVVGGGKVCGECLQRGLADEVRFSVMPVAPGDGIHFFQGMDRTVALHLLEVKAYRSGIVALRHQIRQ